MTLRQTYNSLCSPAKLYLVMQSVAILLLFVQNLRDTRHYRVGSYKIPLSHHNVLYFIVKVAVLVFWTWALNKFCSKGYKGVAWFLVLIPFILFFVAIGMLVVSGHHKSKNLSQKTNYQPIYMHNAPTHRVLQAGHTVSCECPKCGSDTGGGPPKTNEQIVYGREGPITQNYPTQNQIPSNAPQQYIIQ
jgi:hypothetical protein